MKRLILFARLIASFFLIAFVSLFFYFNTTVKKLHAESVQIVEKVASQIDDMEIQLKRLNNHNPYISDLEYEWITASDGVIAHGMGVEDHYCTNSLEAFTNSYNDGYRVFETDIHTTQDGIPVLYPYVV